MGSDISLIHQIFEPRQAELLVDLYKNESPEGKKVILEVIGHQLAHNRQILLGNELNQLILLTSQAQFLLEQTEAVQVAVMIFWCLKQPEVLPKVTEQSGKVLGSRCLISLSLFEPALQTLCNRHGAPSPTFYRRVGKAVLNSEGMREVSLNFDSWTNYIHERFI